MCRPCLRNCGVQVVNKYWLYLTHDTWKLIIVLKAILWLAKIKTIIHYLISQTLMVLRFNNAQHQGMVLIYTYRFTASSVLWISSNNIIKSEGFVVFIYHMGDLIHCLVVSLCKKCRSMDVFCCILNGSNYMKWQTFKNYCVVFFGGIDLNY